MSAHIVDDGGAGPVAPDDVIAGRYRLGVSLGRGGSGEVFRARDETYGREVAVKLLWDTRDALSEEGRRESAALRLLSIPGALHLLDDGVHRKRRFFVTEFVPGRPFPGARTPVPWERLRETALGLLETLARVHSLGILHGDLKAANVLVGEDGRATVLDFGLARGPAVTARRAKGGVLSGTPATMAPELFFGAAPTARADLYSVGVMLYEALTGLPPHAATHMAALAAAREIAPPPPSFRVAGVPAEADRLCAALLAPQPDDRPAGAVEALALFDGNVGGSPEPLPEDLRNLFHGPDLVLRLRERAAAALQVRAGDDGIARRRELDAWRRAGLAAQEDGRYRLTRAAMDWLELGIPVRGSATPVPSRLRPFPDFLEFLLRGEHEAAAAEAEREGTRIALEEGRVKEGFALLRQALALVRRGGDTGAETRILARLLHLSLLSGSRDRMREVAYEADRRLGDDPAARAVATLATAALDSMRGNMERAHASARSLAPFEEESTEWARLAVEGLSLRISHPEAYPSFLEGVESSLAGRDDRPEIAAALLGWKGAHAYRTSRYEEAARLYMQGAEGTRWLPRRLLGRSDAVLALFHLGDLDGARRVAVEAIDESRRCGSQDVEVTLVSHARCIEVMAPGAPPPDPELEDLLELTDTNNLSIVYYMREAALWWRRGRMDEAWRLAHLLESRQDDNGGLAIGILSRSLRIALGGPMSTRAVDSLVAACRTHFVPGGVIQCLALLALRVRPVPDEWKALARSSLERIPGGIDDLRREVLSLRESMEILEGERTAPDSEPHVFFRR